MVWFSNGVDKRVSIQRSLPNCVLTQRPLGGIAFKFIDYPTLQDNLTY